MLPALALGAAVPAMAATKHRRAVHQQAKVIRTIHTVGGDTIVVLRMPDGTVARLRKLHPVGVVGGHRAAWHTVPWQAQIFSTSAYSEAEIAADAAIPVSDPNKQFLGERGAWQRDHRCGGAWLGANWVVTAAHCIYRPVTGHQWVLDDRWLAMRQVRLGTQAIGAGGEVHAIRYALVHAGYAGAASPDHDNDIALLKLSDSATIDVDAFAQPIALDRGGQRPPAGTPLIVAGWGMTEAQAASGLRIGNMALRADASATTFDPMSSDLKVLAVRVVDPAACAKVLEVDPAMLAHAVCGLAPPDKAGHLQDQCSGDSGGPLWRGWKDKHKADHELLVGLVSWGRGCAQADANGQPYPGVFTSVAAYVPWIDAARTWADAMGTALDGHVHAFSIAGKGGSGAEATHR